MGSIIDLTFVSDILLKDLQKNIHFNDHQTIILQARRRWRAKQTRKVTVVVWIFKKLNKQMFEKVSLQATMPRKLQKKRCHRQRYRKHFHVTQHCTQGMNT